MWPASWLSVNLPGLRLSNIFDEAFVASDNQEMIMTRAKYLLLTAALAVAFATPALALNPQPLPPGFKSYVNAGKYGQGFVQMRKAGGSQFRR
jgi:hypothetical protein